VKYLIVAGLCLWSFVAGAAPNIVLLSVDTLRADRLGAYGYALPTSPTLDEFAKSARVFEDAVCEVPLTGPSMGAMLSSQFPRTTGTTRNGLAMPSAVPLVAEQFQAAGYHTFGVLSNWTLKDKLSGLGRGFDIYDDGFTKKRWGFLKSERDGDEVTALSLDYLEKRPVDKPFFAWIHYSDPHAPYKMHKGLNPSGKRVLVKGRKEKIRARYDSEVAFTDREIAKVLAALPADTVVVFVADHGESLFEHDYLGHGRRIYQNNLHIPLMIRGEGIEAGRSAVPVRGVDVGPTLLGLAGLPKLPGMQGLDLLHDEVPMDRVRVVETYGGAVPNIPGVKDAMADSGPSHRSVIHQGWKLILDGDDPELYFLPEDPGELTERLGTDPGKREELNAFIEAWEDAAPAAGQATENLDADDRKALEALGYLE
jgi:arylsulfatase A-like enzyme